MVEPEIPSQVFENKDSCISWRAHLSWYSLISLALVSLLSAFGALWVLGIYHDAPSIPPGGQLVSLCPANPQPTFFMVRAGDVLTLIRNRTPIAVWLTLLFSIVGFLVLVSVYQVYRCKQLNGDNGAKYAHLVPGGFIAAWISLMWLGAYPMAAVGERIQLDPQADALLINGERYATLHEITSFGRENSQTGSRTGSRELFVANRGPGKWVVLDALGFGPDVLSSRAGASSVEAYLTLYMGEMRGKYPNAVHEPWPDFRTVGNGQ